MPLQFNKAVDLFPRLAYMLNILYLLDTIMYQII